MVKRICWFGRTDEFDRETVDARLRETIDLPPGLPMPGWMRPTPMSVELSAERFPGSSPVWIWEE